LAVDILRHKAPDENLLPETLDQIEYSVRLMSGVVKSFVEYSKPIRLEFEEVSLRDLVDQALRVTDAGLRGINVITALEQACPKITVDPKKLVQVLLNIILNAAEAMPEGGNLTISSSFTPSEGGNSLLLSFSDTGHGIDPKDIARIQEHFVTTKPHGIGLGIPICKKIIEAHGGSLEITSALGAGTTVLISLAVH
jgi:signal transduction histidine kinase